LEENSGRIAADTVRESRRRSNGWNTNGETELEIENLEKAEACAYEKNRSREITLMQVVFNIPGRLREFTGNQSAVRVEVESGANLLQALQALFQEYPGLRDRVLTETGETRRHVNIFVANENVRYTGGLATSIPASAEVSIVPAISGG
jgi:molybdopterin converting factor small subunit